MKHILAIFIAATMAAVGARAAQPEEKGLMVDYVPPEHRLGDENVYALNAMLMLPDTSADANFINWSGETRRDALEKWRKFEAEYGAPNREADTIVEHVENSLYRFYATLYAFTLFTEKLREDLTFNYIEYQMERHRGYWTPPRVETTVDYLWHNARFEPVINYGRGEMDSYFGVRVVIPVGR
jgi:hypothetical protein